MNTDYIARALCFHGQPMQKIWEDERGAGDLQKCGIPQQPNYAVYQERQKHFTFQDRAKRLKLHQFFARKATDLYDRESTASGSGASTTPPVVVLDDDEENEKIKSNIAVMPPYEVFVNKNQDKIKRWRSVLEGIKPGDIIYGVVTRTGTSLSSANMMIKPLCTAEPLVRYLSDILTKAYVQQAHIATLPVDKRGNQRNYQSNDFVCCEVLEISVDAERMNLTMENSAASLAKNKNVKLGHVSLEELPAYYRKASYNGFDKYEECLCKSKEFLNPNYDILYELIGLNVNDTFTLMNTLKYPFPRQEYATELRQAQASKWAFRSVAEGIEHFKIGHHVEAFQCLNKALNIDPRNVEGLVARGALYANKGSFLKAVEDFEKALKLNSYHVNARKYMGETLVALGRSHEEDNRIKAAAKAYRDCLNIIPNHEQARLSLELIQQRTGGAGLFENLLNISGPNELEKQKKKKRSTSSSSGSEDDEDSSAQSGSGSDSENSDKKDASLSPLSKRMALHAATLEAAESTKQQFNQPFYMAASYNSAEPAVTSRIANDFKLDDDDTETRVRKLLQEASKHKKEKTKKSKKKKSKKSKKDSHKAKEASTLFGKIDFQEAYNAISSLNIESKLSENLQMYEKTIAEIKKRQEIIQQSTSANSNASSSRQSRKRSETPPPKPPSMKITNTQSFSVSAKPLPSSSSSSYAFAGTSSSSSSMAAVVHKEPPKLSFQIKRPVRVDKFGLVRIATPLAQKSPTPPPRRSRSLSPRARCYRVNRHKSRSRSRSRSRSASYGGGRRRHRRTRSRSNSHISRHSRRSPSRGHRRRSHSRGGHRRTPSPFVPRGTPSPRHRSRSRDRRRRSRSPLAHPAFGNRVWQRPGYNPPPKESGSQKSSSSDGRWKHDKFDDGPSIEEIDEIINKAQKERKQEIIKRDKDILKKAPGSNF